MKKKLSKAKKKSYPKSDSAALKFLLKWCFIACAELEITNKTMSILYFHKHRMRHIIAMTSISHHLNQTKKTCVFFSSCLSSCICEITTWKALCKFKTHLLAFSLDSRLSSLGSKLSLGFIVNVSNCTGESLSFLPLKDSGKTCCMSIYTSYFSQEIGRKWGWGVRLFSLFVNFCLCVHHAPSKVPSMVIMSKQM